MSHATWLGTRVRKNRYLKILTPICLFIIELLSDACNYLIVIYKGAYPLLSNFVKISEAVIYRSETDISLRIFSFFLLLGDLFKKA